MLSINTVVWSALKKRGKIMIKKFMSVFMAVFLCGSAAVYAQQKITQGKDFSGKEMESSNFKGMDLHGMKFNNSDLDDSNFEGANLTGADFTKAELGHCNFKNANLTKVIFTSADLEDSNLQGAKIDGAIFENAELEDVIWIDGKTCADNSVGKCN